MFLRVGQNIGYKRQSEGSKVLCTQLMEAAQSTKIKVTSGDKLYFYIYIIPTFTELVYCQK